MNNNDLYNKNNMSRLVNEIVKKVMKNLMMEADFKIGDSIKIPGSEAMGRKILRLKYGVDPNDFDYIGDGKMGKFIYKVKPKKSRPSTKKPKFKSQDLGRKEGETEQEYLERVREINPKFADVEKEIPGEEWRPLQNTGRYFGGATDYTRSHEVSNMGRIRTIDFADPMRSRISTGYDAPTRNARQFHLDTHDEAGEAQKTTPPIHTMVADAWLDAPEGNIEDYDIEHIDGNYHNNRADNLRYVLRKGRRGRKANAEMPTEAPLAESVRRMIKESIRRVLNEWADGKDTILAYHVVTVGGDDSDQAEADFAYEIYDKLTHNEISVDKAMWELTNGNLEADTEPEAVPRSAIEFGTNTTGKYFLTYDKFTGAFDVWARGE